MALQTGKLPNGEAFPISNREAVCMPFSQNKQTVWTYDQHTSIVNIILQIPGVEYVQGREEYTMLRELKTLEDFRKNDSFPKTGNLENPDNYAVLGDGVKLSFPMGIDEFTPPALQNTKQNMSRKPFLLPFDVQCSSGIGDDIESFQKVRSDALCINIGFDTEFVDPRDGSENCRRVLSLQASVQVGSVLIRYFFLVDPRYPTVCIKQDVAFKEHPQ